MRARERGGRGGARAVGGPGVACGMRRIVAVEAWNSPEEFHARAVPDTPVARHPQGAAPRRPVRTGSSRGGYFFFATFGLGFAFFSVSEPGIAVAFVASSVLSPPTPSRPKISFNRVALPTRERR